jgi:predicted AAA+ superfamily ATPase
LRKTIPNNSCAASHPRSSSTKCSTLRSSFALSSDTPKLYFNDTGLLCFLLGLDLPSLERYPQIGLLWETLVLSEVRKAREAWAPEASLWFYRDKDGLEVDLVVDQGGKLALYEVKWTELPTARDVVALNKVADQLGARVSERGVLARGSRLSALGAGISVRPGWTIGELWRPGTLSAASPVTSAVVQPSRRRLTHA